MKHTLSYLVSFCLILGATTYCSKKKSNKSSDAEQSGTLVLLPDVDSVNMNNLGSPTTAALDEAIDCSSSENRGIFSVALGGACSLSPFVSSLLLGGKSGDYDGDGALTCGDYDAAKASDKDSGLLLSLMCDRTFRLTPNLTDLLVETDPGNYLGISFSQFDAQSAAAGAWSSGNEQSYPANIRLYQGSDKDNLSGLIAMSLASRTNGTVWVNTGDEGGFQAKATFSTPADTTQCKSNPSSTTCIHQDVRIYAPNGLGSLSPSGIHLEIWADSKENPSFYAIEGRYTYSAASAQAIFGAQPNLSALAATRDLYFKTVQSGTSLWGVFDFRGENNATFTWAPNGIDYLAILRNSSGICQDLTSATRDNTSGTCADSMKSLPVFVGYDSFSRVSESPAAEVDFSTNRPARVGIYQAQ